MLTEQRDFREEIDDAIRERELFKIIRNELTDREARVVFERFWNDKTLRDIGASLNICSSRVGQIVQKAVRKLRKPARLALFVKLGGPLGLAAEKRFKEECKCS